MPNEIDIQPFTEELDIQPLDIQPVDEPAKKPEPRSLWNEVKPAINPLNWPKIMSNAWGASQQAIGKAMGLEHTPTAQEAAKTLANTYGEDLLHTTASVANIVKPGLLDPNNEQALGISKGMTEFATGLILGTPEFAPAIAAGAVVGPVAALPMASSFSMDMFNGAKETWAAADVEDDPEIRAQLRTGAVMSALMGAGIVAGPAAKLGVDNIRERVVQRRDMRAAADNIGSTVVKPPLQEAREVSKADLLNQLAEDVANKGTMPAPSGIPVIPKRDVFYDENMWGDFQVIAPLSERVGKGQVEINPDAIELPQARNLMPETPQPSRETGGGRVSFARTADGEPAWYESKLVSDATDVLPQAAAEAKKGSHEEAQGLQEVSVEQAAATKPAQPAAPVINVSMSGPEVSNAIQEQGAGGVGVRNTSTVGEGVGEQNKAVETPEAKGATPPEETVGIAPGADAARALMNRFGATLPEGEAAVLRVDREHIVPRLQPYGDLKNTVTRPQGFGKTFVLGQLIDPRYDGGDPVQGALIVNAHSKSVGDNIVRGVISPELRRKYGDAFEVDPETGRVTNVLLGDGKSPYTSDILEAYYRKESGVTLNEKQKAFADEAKLMMDDALQMAVDEGIPRAELLKYLNDENGGSSYFPRMPIGKRGVDTEGGPRPTTGLSDKPSQFQHRIAESEQQGAEKFGIIYAPDPIARVENYLRSLYHAVANHRLVNDKALGGETVRERYESIAENSFPELAALKRAIGISTDKAKQKELYSAYITLFDGLASEYRDAFGDFKERAEHVVYGKEGRVNHPSLQGQIFPKEIADKLNVRLAPTEHKFVNFLRESTALQKALWLAQDASSFFTQLLPMFFYKNDVWRASTAAGVKALFDTDYLKWGLSDPVLRDVSNEFVQLGGTVGRLGDWMQGVEKGGVVGKLIDTTTGKSAQLADKYLAGMPGSKLVTAGVKRIGKITNSSFERTGALFGASLDMAKIFLYASLRDSVPLSERHKVVEGIENLVGSARTRQIGMHPAIVDATQIMEMAAQYYHSAPNLVANLFERGATGKMTRTAMGRFSAGVMFTSVAGMIAMGLSEDQIIDKLKRGDLTVPVPWFGKKKINVGFNHILISLSKLFLRTIGAIEDDKPINGGGITNNPVLRWLWSHSGSWPSFLGEVATGRDYNGNNISITHAILKRAIPLTIGTGYEAVRQKEEYQTAVGDSLPSFFGLTAYPQSYRQQYMEIANKAAKEKYSKMYDSLSVLQQADVVKAIKNDERITRKPESSPAQIQSALEAEQRRVNRITKSLDAPIQKAISDYGLRVRGFESKLNLRGVDVYLNEKQQDRMRELVTEEYNTRLKRGLEMLEKRPESKRQEYVDDLMQTARRRAKARFIRESRDEAAKPTAAVEPEKPAPTWDTLYADARGKTVETEVTSDDTGESSRMKVKADVALRRQKSTLDSLRTIAASLEA